MMITHMNAKLAILITSVVVVVLGVLFVLVLRTPITNLAEELTKNSDGRSVLEVSTGTPIPLVPGVSLTIKDAQWLDLVVLPKRPAESGSQTRIRPLNREFRFLSVDFEIENETDDWMSRNDLSALIQVVGDDGPPIEGMDSFSLSVWEYLSYRVRIIDRYLEMPPDRTFVGSWIFELDSNRSNLKLVSNLIGFEFTIPVDGG